MTECTFDTPHTALWCAPCTEAEMQARQTQATERLASAVEDLMGMADEGMLPPLPQPPTRPPAQPKPQQPRKNPSEGMYRWKP